MRCFPFFPRLQNLYQRNPDNSAHKSDAPSDSKSGQSNSSGFHDALYNHLDNVRPYSKAARAKVARVKKTLESQLRPVGESISMIEDPAGASKGFQSGFQTGFQHIVKNVSGADYRLALPNNTTVIRAREEIETHLLIESYLKSRYGNPKVSEAEIIQPRNGRGRKWSVITDLFRFRRHRNAVPEKSQPLLDHAPTLPARDWKKSPRAGEAAAPNRPDRYRHSGLTSSAPQSNNRNGGQALKAEQRIHNFFAERQLKSGALNLRDVLAFNHRELEENHKFIQWLFPTDDPSKFNLDAPVVSGDALIVLRKHRTVTDSIEAGLGKMLEFYGLEGSDGKIVIRPGQEQRVQEWLVPGGHHCLRMTRILRCLSLFGKSEKAEHLFAFLNEAVRQMPHGQRVQMQKPLDFWRDALNKPVALANSPAACTSLFFPNKRLSANLARDDPGTPTGDSPVKAALLKKQEALFEQLKLEQTQAPLIAHFSKPEWVARYQASRHMDDRVGDNALACAVGVCADYYFSPEIVPSGAGMTPVKQDNSVYKVHVDFANKALGGAWRQAHGYAQEEIAFLENTGLGAVAQHATKVQETAQGAAIQISKHTNFGATFSTRINNTPAPLLIEGCVRVAQFGSYGRAAMNLSKEKALNSLKQAQPETTNWLAIAAPDLRPTSRLNLTRAEQFTDIFRTAHAGFSMTNAIADGKKVEIHTGKLGCGVFKNDVTISIAAQLLAAKLTGIAHVQFHDIDNEDAARFNEVKATIDRCIAESLAAVPREKIGALVGRTFQAIETNRLINRRSAAA